MLLVPFKPNSDYKVSIEEALEMIKLKMGLEIERLVFGNLDLENLREWLVKTWPAYEIHTPLFNFPYPDLLVDLWRLQAEQDLLSTLSTDIIIEDTIIPKCTPYTSELVDRLGRLNIDLILENGEGYTLVFPKAYIEFSEASSENCPLDIF
ncbi:MAG TPA: hypothetical protein DCW35_08400 [Polynucleobacter sp.]|nr:hypothetical protein [Polynucleobacter sp.]